MNCIYKKLFEYKIIFASYTKLMLNAGHNLFLNRQLQYLTLQGRSCNILSTLWLEFGQVLQIIINEVLILLHIDQWK